MVVEFSVANYLSFKDKVTLSFVASPDDAHPDNVIRDVDPGGLDLLRSVVVYGANASGKSNLLKAISTMQRIIVGSASGQRRDHLPLVPFKLDESTAGEPSEFELVFVDDEERYVYGFTADANKVHEEWLTATRRKPRVLFERSTDNEVYFGPSWRGERVALQNRTRPNALLLSVAAQFNHAIAQHLLDVIDRSIVNLTPAGYDFIEWLSTVAQLERDTAFRELVDELLQMADVGIEAVTVDRVPHIEETVERPFGRAVGRRMMVKVEADGVEEVLQIRALHRTGGGSAVEFEMDTEESAGTQRLFALAAPWSYAARNGALLLVDEVDAHLHPLLTRFLVSCSHDTNSRGQFLFTTHDTTLLDPELFRRDQIWFAEKKPDGATDLYSLWDYKEVGVRNNENYQKNYLQGRYGAIPFVGEFCFGQEEAERCPQD